MYKFIGTKGFSIFENSLTKHPIYVEMYDPTPKHVMFIFRVPDEYQIEYDLFRSERPKIYRRFSDAYKSHIIKFMEPMYGVDELKSILYSHETRFKQLELDLGVKIPRDIDNYSIPSMDEEIFNKVWLS